MMLILCGKSGSGKDAITNHILNTQEDVEKIVSTTSRPMREGEVEGREYNFLSKENFLKGIDDGDFIEYRAYNTLVDGIPDEWYYGTKKFEPACDKVLIAIKDLQGAKVLKDYCEEIGENCECVLIEVPDDIREERAKKRGSFNQIEWDRRLEADALDFSQEKKDAVVDRVVVNDGTHSLEAVALMCFTPVRDVIDCYKKDNFDLE